MELLKLFKNESEVKLTDREKNVFIWSDFLISEEENLTDEEKKAWEVRK